MKEAEAVDASTFYLNLSFVEKSYAEGMMATLASSSAKEIGRQEYLYSQPAKQTLVHLDGLFPQFQKPRLSEQHTAIAGKQSSEDADLPSAETRHGVVAIGAGASNASAVVVGSKEDAPSC